MKRLRSTWAAIGLAAAGQAAGAPAAAGPAGPPPAAAAAVTPAAPAAVPPAAGPFDVFLRKVQRDSGSITREEVQDGLRAGLALGRPAAASAAARLYLAQTPAPAPETVRLAAECARLSGDLLAAVARYKQYLAAATPDAASGAAAGTLGTLLLDYLGNGDEAFRFLDEQGERFRGAIEVRKFDPWFLDYAVQQRNYAALARHLARMFSEARPLEEERTLAWERLDWLLTEVAAMRPEMLAAAPHLRAVSVAIRESPARQARAAFLAATLSWRAGAEGKDDAALAREADTAVQAATAFAQADPDGPVLADIAAAWGSSPDLAKRALSRLREGFADAFLKSPPAARERFLQGGSWRRLEWFFTPEFWTALALRSPDWLPGSAARNDLRFVTAADDPAMFRRLAPALQGVRSWDAAVVGALAAGDDPSAGVAHLVTNAWFLDLKEMWDAFRRVADTHRQYAAAAKRPEMGGAVLLARFGRAHGLASPLMLHPETARDILRAVWAVPDEAKPSDKAAMLPVLTGLTWVPYGRREDRQDAFGPAYADFRQWAEQIRRSGVRDAETQRGAELASALDDAFRRLLDPSAALEPERATHPLCRGVASVAAAARARDAEAHAAAVRSLYAAVRDFEKTRQPFGAAVLRWVARQRSNDPAGLDLQIEMLADQLARSDEGPSLGARIVWSRICADRPGWGEHGAAPRNEKPGLQKLNGALAKALTDALARDRFWPDVFGWFRATRAGQDWTEHGWNADVMERLLQRQTIQKSGVALPRVGSGTLACMRLVRGEFNVLDAKYPVSSFFDDAYAAEVRATRRVDRDFWRLSSDDNRKVLHAAAEVFAAFPRYPFGWDPALPVYDRGNYWEVLYRIVDRADAAPRRAVLDRLQTGFGTVFFDSYAMGMFGLPGFRKDDAAGRQAFFAAAAAYAERAAAAPWRCGPPAMTPLAALAPRDLSDAELAVLLKVFGSIVPYLWPQGKEADGAGLLAVQALALRQRHADALPLLPALLRTVREMRSSCSTLATLAGEWQQSGQPEAAAALSSLALSLPGMDLREEQRNAFTAVRAKAVNGIAGVIPVERGDPRYALFAAQADYLAGKPGTAWELYLSAQSRFRSAMKDLDPSFVLWVLERHTDAGDFAEAEEISRAMLQWVQASGQGFDRETRARLSLAYANVACARQEYPKARAMYEQIVLAREFDGTQARREAELKVAEVDRLTRQYDSAIQTLDRLSRRGDAFLQAEANYQLALIRYDREEFGEARAALERVFAIEPSHVNGRILEGRVNLRIKKLVEATEVRVGLAGQQDAIVPGRPLKVQLEDRTLAIVGAGGNVEVRAWTDSGDEELFLLLPFGDSRTKFEGQIPTLLGAAVKGDRLLQVRGGDRVHYDFSERFARANRIAGTQAVAIRVAAPAELYASSGRILSREEQEEQALERLVREKLRARSEPERGLLSTRRAANEIKPGNPILVRVVDPDRSVSEGRDRLRVRATTSSGDAIDAVELEETAPFSGVFEGRVPTQTAPATAFASDAEEGREPVYAIAAGDYQGWAGLPDGRRPKTLTVDLNALAQPGVLTIAADEPGRRLRRFAVQTSHSGRDFRTVAAWPRNVPKWDGSPLVEVVRFAGQNRVPRSLAEVQEFLDSGYLAAGAAKIALRPQRPEVAFDDNNAGGQAAELGLAADGVDSWYAGRFAAALYLAQRQVCAFRVDSRGNGRQMASFVAVDGLPSDAKTGEFRGSLGRGLHRVEFYFAAQRRARPVWTLVSDVERPPELTPCTAALFDPGRIPAAERVPLFVPAAIAADEAKGAFTVTFPAGAQARTLRLVLADFEGQAPAIRRLTLVAADGSRILPPATDIVSLRRNQTLEIVPGDRIAITYEDPAPADPRKAVSETALTATFNDAQVEACFVESSLLGDGTREPVYIPMRRFRVGDALTLFVNDPDMDISDQPDPVAVTVRAQSGQPVSVKAIETEAHSGVFIARVFPVAQPPQRPTEFQVGPGEDAVVAYMDRENTDPGIPWERTAVLEQAGADEPELRVYSARSRPLTDSERAAPAARRVARLHDETVAPDRALVVYRPADGRADNVVTTLVAAPLMIELVHPAQALSAESEAVVYVQTGRGRARSGLAPDAPFDLDVPGTVRLAAPAGDFPNVPPPVGYRSVTVEGNRYAHKAIDDGRFSFVLPMELAALPDRSAAAEAEKAAAERSPAGRRRRPAADEAEEPRLAVCGTDTVYVAFSLAGPGGTNRWIARTAVLASDAWLHVLDRRYETELTAAHVGEVVYPRVLDAASDLTDAQDEVEVTVSGLPGGPRTVRLGETFGHSGVFKGALTLRFAGEAAAGTAAPDTLAVNYGNELSFACARPGAAAPLRSALRIHKGADGAVAPFTKQFRDPEIAVQTQFTAAEAYFEMAKKHRELGQKDVAHREIAQGRKLLEEALRDSPKSEARAHADYLLAELSLQFAEEASDPAERQRCCLDAISRFTEIVATFPESPQAPKSQFKKALAFEKMGQIDQACEEYVKLSYRYPENELVAETIARLGNYFTVKNRELADKAKAQTSPVEVEKLMTQARASATTAAQVFGRLFERFPDHPLAWKTQVLSGQCYMRAENYDKAVEVFKRVVTAQKAEPDLIGQAMYWCGDCHMKSKRLVEAYQAFKKLTWDYPESVWAKYARGRLSEEALSQIEEQDAGGGK